MIYNLYFDISAIFINILIIIFFYYRKFLPIRQNRIFVTFVFVLLGTTILEIITSYHDMKNTYSSRVVSYILNCLFLMGTNSFGVFFSFYTLSLADYWSNFSLKKRRAWEVCILLPYAFELILIVLTPFLQNTNKAVFYLDVNNIYHRGNFSYILFYIITFLYMINILTILFIFHKKISFENKALVAHFIVAVLLSVAIQYCFPSLLVTCFIITLTSLTFLFFIQKPEKVLDSITGLFNQSAFIKYFSGIKKSDEKISTVTVTIKDIDFLINTYGLSGFNELLKIIGDTLIHQYSYSRVFYVGQGKFAVLVKNSKEKDINQIIHNLDVTFQRMWTFNDIKIKLYTQICVVKFPNDAKSPEEYFDIINTVFSSERYTEPVVFADKIDLNYRHEFIKIEHAVRKGLSERRYEVYYQPIFSAADKRVIGGEALIRLRGDDGNPISPEDFIPIAEKNGTVLRIGEFVLETVFSDLAHIDLEEAGVKKIDINLSVAQCMQEILADQIIGIQTIFNIPNKVINLEITETALAHTPEVMEENIKKLVEAGFEFSLDDYGSGYSNMSYMLNMPFSMIKIDKYIVWSAYKEKRSETALKCTIDMIKKLGMTILAEGVETKEQADWLLALGCDYLQGYYYSKPCPFNEFLPLLKKKW